MSSLWAIVCGSIRIELEFYSVISRLLNYRNLHKIDGIILSTWVGEVDKYDGLRDKLVQLNIKIIESEPFEDLSKYMNMSYSQQIKQINSALNEVPDGVFVLKCRTDFSMDPVKTLVDSFSPNNLTITDRNIFNCDLKYKIHVMELALSIPFSMSDLAFIAYKDDLLKMSRPIMYLECGYKYLPDYTIFVNPFKKFKLLTQYYQLPYFKIAELIKINDKKLPQPLVRFISFYLNILEYCFYSKTKDTNYDLIDLNKLFYTDNSEYCQTYWIKAILSSNIVHKIVLGQYVPKDFFGRVPPESFLKNCSTDLCFEFSTQEINELNGTFGINSDYNEIMEKSSYEDPLSIYPTIYQSNTCKNVFTNILNSETYYNELITNLPVLRNTEGHLYILGLIASARRLNDNICLELASKLYHDQIPTELIAQSEFIFRRYGVDGTKLFKIPYTMKRLRTNYYMSLYFRDRYPIYELNFIRTMCREYAIKTTSTKLELFFEEVSRKLSPTENNRLLLEFIEQIKNEH